MTIVNGKLLYKTVPFSQYGNTQQQIAIAPGVETTVYSFTLPESMRGFLTEIASTFFIDVNGNTSVSKLVIDGVTIEQNIVRAMGKFDEPKRFFPPLFVMRKIEFITRNDTSENMTMNVYINGFMVHYQETVGV